MIFNPTVVSGGNGIKSAKVTVIATTSSFNVYYIDTNLKNQLGNVMFFEQGSFEVLQNVFIFVEKNSMSGNMDSVTCSGDIEKITESTGNSGGSLLLVNGNGTIQ